MEETFCFFAVTGGEDVTVLVWDLRGYVAWFVHVNFVRVYLNVGMRTFYFIVFLWMFRL